jgi:hypothetical protein
MKTYYNTIKILACLLIILFLTLYFIKEIGGFSLGVGIGMSIGFLIGIFLDEKDFAKERS